MLLVKCATRNGELVVCSAERFVCVGIDDGQTVARIAGVNSDMAVVTVSAEEAFKRIAEALRTGEVSVDLTQ